MINSLIFIKICFLIITCLKNLWVPPYPHVFFFLNGIISTVIFLKSVVLDNVHLEWSDVTSESWVDFLPGYFTLWRNSLNFASCWGWGKSPPKGWNGVLFYPSVLVHSGEFKFFLKELKWRTISCFYKFLGNSYVLLFMEYEANGVSEGMHAADAMVPVSPAAEA